MNQKVLLTGGIVLAATVFVLVNSFFTVYQTQQALITQFGNPVRVIT